MKEEKFEEGKTFLDPSTGQYDVDFELVMMQVLMFTSYSKAWKLIKTIYEVLVGVKCVDNPSLIHSSFSSSLLISWR